MKRKELTQKDYERIGLFDGYIVEWKAPMEVHEQKWIPVTEGEHKGHKRLTATGKIAMCKFMRVHGGFGACSACSGRMWCGDFFETLKEAQENQNGIGGNTKQFPNFYYEGSKN